MSGDGYTFLGYPDGTYAAAAHSHAGADVTSGTVAYGRLPVGTAASTVAAGDHTHVRALTSGQWRANDGSSQGTGTHAAGTERAQLIHLRPGTTLAAVGICVITLAASSVVRLGARVDTGGRPGNLLADWGTVDSTGIGVKTLPITFTSPSDTTRLWLVAAAQGGSPVLATRLAGSDIDGLTAAELLTNGTIPGCLTQTGVTGALPNTFTLAASLNSATLIAVQAA